jgi:hypothetical protein
MKPGRELDALVAEKVMGWTKEELLLNSSPSFRAAYQNGAPFYSTSIEDAWQVVEKFKTKDPAIFFELSNSITRQWECYLGSGRANEDTAPPPPMPSV